MVESFILSGDLLFLLDHTGHGRLRHVLHGMRKDCIELHTGQCYNSTMRIWAERLGSFFCACILCLCR